MLFKIERSCQGPVVSFSVVWLYEVIITNGNESFLLQYIRKHRKPIITFEDALKQAKEEMGIV